MHYHYGNGKEYIPFQKLRRMAALLVACDPLIVQLHPQHRRVNEYCMSNRLYSRIAHGRPAAVASREINAEYIEAEPEFPTNRPKTKPVARPSRMRTPNFLVPFQRGTLTGYDLTDEFFYLAFTESGYDYDNIVENPRPLEIPYAVREILRCTNAPTVAELMRHTPLDAQRPAYSFKAYSHGEYKHTIMQDGQNVLEYQYKRTVEFRQMASTMDPNCVVAHGKIVVRLCEIAASMELEELYQVALDCAVGETNGDWFDVFDLLAEFGLESEAKVLQYPVAEFRGEIIPEEVVNDQAQAEGAEERTGQWLSWLGWLS
ncbi:hypothetical protein F4801DRAFT_560489 [Xylaria longipes]|nr:hypothetical protein F4801DRAFT_560489 [Xylaria longipes]